MKRKRDFFISGVFILFAGLFAHFAAIDYMAPFSIVAIVIGAVLFIAGVIIFAVTFRE